MLPLLEFLDANVAGFFSSKFKLQTMPDVYDNLLLVANVSAC
jgi:hypothetical protein